MKHKLEEQDETHIFELKRTWPVKSSKHHEQHQRNYGCIIMEPTVFSSILYFIKYHFGAMFLTLVPDKKSVAKACCWSAERGHTSPCASGRNADVCPPAVSLQPAVTTWIIEHQFPFLADDAPPYKCNLLTQGCSNKTPLNTNPSSQITHS